VLHRLSAMEMAAEAAATASKNNAEMQQFQELQQQIELQRLQQSQQMFLHQQRIQEIQVNKPNSLFINTFFFYIRILIVI
jgi:hypothetical protein